MVSTVVHLLFQIPRRLLRRVRLYLQRRSPNPAHRLGHILKLLGPQGLGAVAQGVGRVVVDLDNQAVRAAGCGGQGHGLDIAGHAGGVAGVHDDVDSPLSTSSVESTLQRVNNLFSQQNSISRSLFSLFQAGHKTNCFV